MIAETAKKPRKGSWGRNPRGPKRDTHRAPSGFSKAAKTDSSTPISQEDTLKIVPLGGLGEIGKNMCFLEYKDDIIVIDAGFKFPDEDFLGVDYIIPNTEYLEKNRDKIRGVLFTHGHMALFIKTPAGNIVHTADFKFDHSPTSGQPIDLDHLRGLGDKGVTLLMSDSTGAEREGHSISEKTIMENLDLIFQESKQMIVCGTFSSLIYRIQQII